MKNTDRFYIPYGTLPPNALCYVSRDADEELFEGLTQGEFCYVLTSRQMGKSSLMVHTIDRLRAAGISVALLDLTALGFNLDAEQWYNGLLDQLGKRLKLQDDVEDYCLQRESLSPLQRWQSVLTEVVLKRIAGQIVIFVDEIDIVRSLPFSTDEFFAAIRACYNARTEEAAYHRLTFCLLGVAMPSDLIQDSRLTPFNIGRRIHLNDFSKAEAGLLQHGLGRDSRTNQRLMERILYWTGGHPCLTQRLCKAVSEDREVRAADGVDACCERAFLAADADHRDDNLEFVKQRLLTPEEADPAGLLTLYEQVLKGKRVEDNETVPLIGRLKLSGVVRVEGGRLAVRNWIYERVLNRSWVGEHMPGAELRRQRAAYRRGLLRAATISAAILAVMAALAGVALIQAQRATKAARRAAKAEADRATQIEQEKQNAELLARYKYVYGIFGAQEYLKNGNIAMAFRLLEQQRKTPQDPVDRRGFEWRYLWQQCQGDLSFFYAPKMIVLSVALSPDGRFVAAGGQDGSDEGKTVRLWDAVSRREIAILKGPAEANCLAFSPDGTILAAGGGIPFSRGRPGVVKFWRVAKSSDGMTQLQELAPLAGFKEEVWALAFSPDSKMLAAGSADKMIRLWDVASRRVLNTVPTSSKEPWLAFSPDGKTLAFDCGNGQVGIWNVPTRRLIYIRSDPAHYGILSVAFSPDDRLFATGNRNVRLWGVRTGDLLGTLPHPNSVHSVAFSPDGKTLATGCWDDIIRLWNVASGREQRELVGHLSLVNSIAFARNGRTLLSGSNDGTVRVWDVNPQNTLPKIVSNGAPIRDIVLSHDGRMVAAAGMDGTVRLRDAATGRSLATFKEPKAYVYAVAFSPDGRMLASGSSKDVRLWNVSFGDIKSPSEEPSANRPAGRETPGDFTPKSTRLSTGPINHLAFSGDGKIILIPSVTGVTLWDTASYRKIDCLKKYLDGAGAIALSPDGDTLAVTGGDVQHAEYGDGTVELWSLRKRQLLAAIRGAHMNSINTLVFSLDGKILATGGWDGTIKLWNLTNLHVVIDGRSQIPPTLRDFAGQVNSLAFSPDGKTLAVGNEDHTIKIWNLATREEVAVLSGHTAEVTGVAFAPDGNLLISGSLDGTIRFWRAAPFSRTDDPQRKALGDRVKH